MTEQSLAPIGARVRAPLGGELGTIVAISQDEDSLTAVISLDNGLPLRKALRDITEWIPPTKCSVAGCDNWAMVEAQKGDRVTESRWTPFCDAHKHSTSKGWAEVRAIGEGDRRGRAALSPPPARGRKERRVSMLFRTGRSGQPTVTAPPEGAVITTPSPSTPPSVGGDDQVVRLHLAASMRLSAVAWWRSYAASTAA